MKKMVNRFFKDIKIEIKNGKEKEKQLDMSTVKK